MSDLRVTFGADWSAMSEGWTLLAGTSATLYIGPSERAPFPFSGWTTQILDETLAGSDLHQNVRSDNGQTLRSTDGGFFFNLSDRTAQTKVVGGTFGDLIQTGSGNDTIDGGKGNDT